MKTLTILLCVLALAGAVLYFLAGPVPEPARD